MNNRYRILARCVKGTNVLGYKVMSDKGEVGILKKEIIEKLALNKQIDNCSAQLVNGKIYLKGVNCQLRSLPAINMDKSKRENVNKDKYEIVARIDSGKSNIGYRVRGYDGKLYDLNRDIVIDLAREGKVINARAQISNGKLVLRSYKTSSGLKDLEVIQRS